MKESLKCKLIIELKYLLITVYCCNLQKGKSGLYPVSLYYFLSRFYGAQWGNGLKSDRLDNGMATASNTYQEGLWFNPLNLCLSSSFMYCYLLSTFSLHN